MSQRWGLTLPLPGITLADHREHVELAEASGYTDLWTGETAGPDGFTPLALSAAWTERMRLRARVRGGFQRRRAPAPPAPASCSASAPPRIESSKAGTGSPSKSR